MSGPLIVFGIPIDVDERFVRASGPGGQNVNKVSSAVQLRFDVHASELPADVKARLLVMAGKRAIGDGIILIDSREYRTQAQNREAARARLLALITAAAVRPRKRTATRPKAGARERRLTTKKIRSDVKRSRSGRPSRDD